MTEGPAANAEDAVADDLLTPAFEYCFGLQVAVAEAIPLGCAVVGEGPHFAPITGGRVTGPALIGQVLAGGGDWWVADGLTVRLDARYVISVRDVSTTAAGSAASSAVEVVNRGIWRTDRAGLARLEAGLRPDETELYYRTAFTFRTEDSQLRWLCESQFIGYARPVGGEVHIRVFRLV